MKSTILSVNLAHFVVLLQPLALHCKPLGRYKLIFDLRFHTYRHTSRVFWAQFKSRKVSLAFHTLYTNGTCKFVIQSPSHARFSIFWPHIGYQKYYISRQEKPNKAETNMWCQMTLSIAAIITLKSLIPCEPSRLQNY